MSDYAKNRSHMNDAVKPAYAALDASFETAGGTFVWRAVTDSLAKYMDEAMSDVTNTSVTSKESENTVYFWFVGYHTRLVSAMFSPYVGRAAMLELEDLHTARMDRPWDYGVYIDGLVEGIDILAREASAMEDKDPYDLLELCEWVLEFIDAADGAESLVTNESVTLGDSCDTNAPQQGCCAYHDFQKARHDAIANMISCWNNKDFKVYTSTRDTPHVLDGGDLNMEAQFPNGSVYYVGAILRYHWTDQWFSSEIGYDMDRWPHLMTNRRRGVVSRGAVTMCDDINNALAGV